LRLDRHKCALAVLVGAATGCELIAGIRDLRLSEVGADADAGPDGSIGDETSPSSDGGDASDASSDAEGSAGDASDAHASDAIAPESGSGDSGDSGSLDGGPGDENTTESGALDAARDGSACLGDLSNIGTGDFHISMTVTATGFAARTALVNQRASCATNFCMQPDTFWDIRLLNGALFIETSDNARNCCQVTTNGPLVNDNKPHRVIVQRVAQRITAIIDGVPSVAADAGASKSSFGALPPVSKTDPCEATGTTVPLPGTLTNLCVTSP
jgi:hypothetical protein